MTIILFDPRTGKPVTITVPDQSTHPRPISSNSK
jgi:hypothetical protein